MALVDSNRAKFHQRSKEFKNFSEINEEKLVEISKKVYERLQQETSLTQNKLGITKLEHYVKTLSYLTAPNVHTYIKNFDERVIYLIMLTDPNLVIYKEFLKVNIIKMSTIESIHDKKLKEALNTRRTHQIELWQSRVREKIGFFDIKMLKYEEIFFNKFFKDKEILEGIAKDYAPALFNKGLEVTDYSTVSKERFAILKDKANVWLSNYQAGSDHRTLAYAICNQKNVLGLKNLTEQLIFFILVFDPELKCLTIYEEESRIEQMEQRTIEEFNYYDQNIIIAEKRFWESFCPDKQLSPWTITKK